MFRRLPIILTLTLLSAAAMAQQPGGSAPKSGQTGVETKKTTGYTRGALSDFMRYAQQVVDQESEENTMVMNEIFILSQEMISDNDDQIGAKMQFFNCFQKPIRQIDVYFIPYNAEGTEQPDASGLSSMKVTCAGRINPTAKAETTFPKMFWNKDKSIQYLLVAKIVFFFFDNSSATFNGINDILKHYK